MQRSIFLISTALIFTVGILANALNNIDEVCKPNLPNGGKAIICHRTGLSNFNRGPPVYNAAFRNDAESICCSSGSQCLLSRNYVEVACYNPRKESRKDIIYTTHFISLGTHFHIGSRGLVISGTLLLVPCFRHDVRFRLGTDEQPNRSNGMNESN